MSTVNFALDTTNFTYGGDFSDASGSGHNWRQFLSNEGLLDFQVTGTALTVQLFSTNTTPFMWQANNGALVNGPTVTANTWTTVTIFTGQPDQAWNVSIRATGIGSLYIDRDLSFSVTGSAPALAPSAYMSANNYNFQSSVNNYGQIPGLAGFKFDGGCAPISIVGYTAISQMPWPDQQIRFRSNATSIRCLIFGQGGSWIIRQDGIKIGSTIAPGGVAAAWVTFASGLSGTHEYTIQIVTNNNDFINQVMTIGGTIDLVTTPAAATNYYAFYGDSITQGNVAGDSSQTWASLISYHNGVTPLNRGISGSTVWTSGSTRTADITAFSVPPKRLYVLYGTNDLAQISGAETTTQFQGYFTTMLNALIAGTTCPIYILGILQRSTSTPTNTALWNAVITTVIATINNPRVRYFDTTNWVNTGSDEADGLHPNALGYSKMEQQLAFAIPSISTGSSVAIRHSSNFTGGI